MTEFIQIGPGAPKTGANRVYWLQGLTLGWMLVECGVSAYAAITARSPAMLAFGSDSLVELFSASVVLLQWTPWMKLSEAKAARASALLLMALAVVVLLTSVGGLVLGAEPETSPAGLLITAAALLVMPVLASLKRREARRRGNVALAADATQSATCAWLALTALAGLALNATLHLAWFDSAAALAAVPLLLKEARAAWKGHTCGCCSC